MPRPIRIARRAQHDIETTLQYTRDECGQVQHDTYRQLIKKTIADIADEPELPPAKNRDELRSDIWARHLGRRVRHLIVYRIAKDGGIEVIRLLHDAMDIERHIPEDYLR